MRNYLAKLIHTDFRKDLLATIISRGILFGSGILISIIIARYLGPEGKGILTAVFVIPTIILTLGDFGIRQATAHLLGTDKYPKKEIVENVLLLYFFTTTLGILICSIIFYFGPAREYDYVLIIFAVLLIPAMLFNTYMRGVALGERKVKFSNSVEVINKFTHLLMVIFFLPVLHLGIRSAALSQVSGSLVASLRSLSLIREIGNIRLRLKPKLVRTMVKLGIAYSLSLFVLTLNYRIDIVVLERMAPSGDIGLYAVGVQLAELLWQIPLALNVVIFSYSATGKDFGESINRTLKVLKYSLVVAVCCSIIILLLAPLIITLLYGQAFLGSVSVTRILIPGVIFALVFKLLHADLAARGRPLVAFPIFFGTAITNVVLNIILIPEYGINGVAFASTVTYTLGALIYFIVYRRI